MLAELDAKVWDPERIVVVTDHYLPADDADSRKIIQITRDWVRDAGVRRFHDGEGICHIVLPENGYLQPGMFCVGGDSHSPTGGAFGSYIFGIGATEMLGAIVTGKIWLRIPQTIRMRFDGALVDGVSAKDIMLMLIARFGLDGADYQVIEFAGTTIDAMTMQERMTLTNMSAELGAQTALIAPDQTTADYLSLARARHPDRVARDQTGLEPFSQWQGDVDAPVAQQHSFDASQLVPMVAAPDSPANSAPVTAHAGTPIAIAYIGACTGAKFDDLRMAARVLLGKRIADGVQLRVAPASALDQRRAEQFGVLAALIDAGATLLPTACGACAGYGQHRFAAGQTAIATTARNFKGRMGDSNSRVYLGSPYTVAASALTGVITDPRQVL